MKKNKFIKSCHKFIKSCHISLKLFNIIKKLEKKKLLKGDHIIPELKKFVNSCKNILDTDKNIRAIMIHLYPKNRKNIEFSAKTVKSVLEIISNYAGEIIIQNSTNDKLIEVSDRNRKSSMHKGSRYHQTREGGSIHTDNVNIPEGWDYLMFACLANSKVGGETILVDSIVIHKELSTKYIKAKKILEKNFFWEKRGIADELYKAPIITYDDKKKPNFRYLRPYLEAAHIKANKKLTTNQLYALNILDALLETSQFQFRYKMHKGDILFNLDSKVLHGRTSFSDALDSISYSEIGKDENRLKRTMIRVWIKNKI